MSVQAITEACAKRALEQLEQEAAPAQESQDTPFEYLRVSEKAMTSVNDVKNQWFKSTSNRQRVAQKHSVEVASIDPTNILVAKPVRYLTTTIKPGYIERPYLDTIMIIIALNRLTQSNGLPRQDPRQPIVLEQGQDLSLSGDDSQTFDGQGGGIAYLLVLRKVHP